MAADLDAQVEAFHTRPLDAGPYTFVAADALVLYVREDGRVVGVHALVATGVNAIHSGTAPTSTPPQPGRHGGRVKSRDR
jgi:transposase-like protein